jgi:hypothetical protein|tara:strand:- start:1731 stop:2423 length:693 start_codon:yes stop_codon:yes gene_type:complete
MADDDQDVFDDEEVAEEVVTEPEKGEKEPEAKAEEPKEDAPTSEDYEKQIAGLKAGISDERRKRQEAQALNKKQEVKVKAPDPVTDPDAFHAYNDDKLNARDQKLKIEMSQSWARKAHDDYDEVEKVFISLITDEDGKITDQTLVDKFNAAELPADFAYDHVKNKQLLDYRGSDDYETSIRQDERKKILEEARSKGVSAADLPDLTNVAASASNTTALDEESSDRIDAFD